MAVTEQQFIEVYKWLDADKQQSMYNAGNAQVKSWIDNYNASQTQTSNYVPTQNTSYTTFNQWSQWNQWTQWYYNSWAYNDVWWVNVWDWNYWIDTADRQEEIVSHLNEYYQQDPSRFSDWDTFARNFNYAYSGRSEKERETMRNWYNQNVGAVPEWTPWYWNIYWQYNDAANTDYFFNMLMQWQQLQWTWAAVTAAQNRYKNYQSLSAMTPDQIASAIASNSLNPVWQDMIDLKNYSPELYAQVQAQLQNQTQINDINAAWQWIYNWLTGTETNGNYTKYDFTTEYAKNASVIKQYNESLYKQIEWLGWDTAAYVAIVASMLQNPLIQANKDEIENLEWEINKIQENIYTIWDTAREKLWSEAPEDLVSAYISHQTKQLQNQLRTAQNSLLVAQWKLDNQLSEVETLVDAINQWIKTYWADWTWTWWNNYQYISWSKYQEAGYFDKSTWQFYKLGETPDTHDYQTDDPARLQEIADNLTNIANSDDVYVFRDRNAFNDYFKYSQRWTAQKQILDNFWNQYWEQLKAPAQAAWQRYQASQRTSWWTWGWSWGSWWGWSGGWGSWNSLKKALLNWTFTWAFSITNLRQYWYKTWWDPVVLMKQVWAAATLEELPRLMNAVSSLKNTSSESWTTYNVTTLQKQIVKWYIEANANTIKENIDARSTTKEKKAYLSSILEPLWLNTKAMREAIAAMVWADY